MESITQYPETADRTLLTLSLSYSCPLVLTGSLTALRIYAHINDYLTLKQPM